MVQFQNQLISVWLYIYIFSLFFFHNIIFEVKKVYIRPVDNILIYKLDEMNRNK